jgi:phospholipid/cholesterol/gamma-HCH transport system substrate-binding protein
MASRAPAHATEGGNRRVFARLAGVLALLAAVVLVAVVFLGGDSGHSYRLLFETGGQLVEGNLVQVGGRSVGQVDEISLTDDAHAEVKVSVDDALHEGTTATIRATSLSGVANRYISLAPGPNSEPEIPGDGVIPTDDTTSPVDIDQLFNTFDARTRKALSGFIEGQAVVYGGDPKQANAAYKYLAPGIQSTERLLDELTSDDVALSQFLASGASVLDAIAARRDDVSALTENANEFLGAIAKENQAFDADLVALPPTLRQANTTFVNLRAALDDLDSFVATTGETTKDLAPFLRELRPVAEKAVPVFRDLRLTVTRRKPANDLGDALADLPGAERAAKTSVPVTIEALDDSQPKIAQLRPYTPDLLAFLGRFGQASSNYDGNGHYLRVQPSGMNLFSWNSTTSVLEPLPVEDQFTTFDNGFFNRCPGGSTQPIPGSNPFLGQGVLEGLCDPAAVPPGP